MNHLSISTTTNLHELSSKNQKISSSTQTKRKLISGRKKLYDSVHSDENYLEESSSIALHDIDKSAILEPYKSNHMEAIKKSMTIKNKSNSK